MYRVRLTLGGVIFEHPLMFVVGVVMMQWIMLMENALLVHPLV